MEDKNALRVVSIMDEAIDENKSDLDAYIRDRDLKHLKFIEGKEPVWFTLRRFSEAEFAVVNKIYPLNSTWVQLACISVENVKRDGETHKILLVSDDTNPTKFADTPIFSDEFWNSLEIPVQVKIELGDLVEKMHFLEENEPKNYLAPPRWRRWRRLRQII